VVKPEPIEIPINVSSRVLRHISRGIYRSPAAALKELVSNSHDAGASEVTLNTGYPTIKELVITDDGSGMTAATFKELVQHIGFSRKTAGESIQIAGTARTRTVIGHYGIGLLAVGQLAARMQIEEDGRYSQGPGARF
jgi:HSP90 family molecular chaperone